MSEDGSVSQVDSGVTLCPIDTKAKRIALDTIEAMDISKEFRYIMVDTFTRYVELFPAYDITAAMDALWRHFCRFGSPLKIITDQGSYNS